MDYTGILAWLETGMRIVSTPRHLVAEAVTFKVYKKRVVQAQIVALLLRRCKQGTQTDSSFASVDFL